MSDAVVVDSTTLTEEIGSVSVGGRKSDAVADLVEVSSDEDSSDDVLSVEEDSDVDLDDTDDEEDSDDDEDFDEEEGKILSRVRLFLRLVFNATQLTTPPSIHSPTSSDHRGGEA